MAPSYKFIYFNARVRGETSRWLLAHAGQEYVDNRVPFPEWGALKQSTPYGQLPVLEVDGKVLGQSRAIERYLARKFGLAGENAWEESQADAIADYVTDAFSGTQAYRAALQAKDQAKAESIKAEYTSTTVPPYLQRLENILKSNNNGQGFFIGSKPTWADLTVAAFVDEVVRFKSTILEGYPLLKGHNARVHELKGIKEYIAKRPETPF